MNRLLQEAALKPLLEAYSHEAVVAALQEALEELRLSLRKDRISEAGLRKRLDSLDTAVRQRLEARFSPSLRPVINASGVILHTNLGRAPLARPAAEAILEVATGYSNLELDLGSGGRGHRDSHLEPQLCRLLGCPAATAANNNAAAVLLILNTLARGRKVLVSRGELVEIGGSFRIPEIMERSGARLREVGTTNKTRLSDYREALDEETALILRVHPSNYRIVGFAERPRIEDLVALSREKGIPLVEDAGSGLLFSSRHPFLQEEPSVRSTLEAGLDLVCFSADKLLGGPQAGIIAGRGDLVEAIRRNPLMRACRLDKMTHAALSWTLSQYERGAQETAIPVQKMLASPPEAIESRARRLACLIPPRWFRVEVVPGFSLIGGGAAPDQTIPTFLLAVTAPHLSVNEMERRLREGSVAVLTRIEEDRLLLDLRTVLEAQEDLIASAFSRLVPPGAPAKTPPGAGPG